MRHHFFHLHNTVFLSLLLVFVLGYAYAFPPCERYLATEGTDSTQPSCGAAETYCQQNNLTYQGCYNYYTINPNTVTGYSNCYINENGNCKAVTHPCVKYN